MTHFGMPLETHVSNALGSSPVSRPNDERGQRRHQIREPSLEEETSQICPKVKAGLQNLQVSLAWRVAITLVGQVKLTGSTEEYGVSNATRLDLRA
jgi:hypothetical protein